MTNACSSERAFRLWGDGLESIKQPIATGPLMKTATLILFTAMFATTLACNRESARTRRGAGAKTPVVENTVEITDANFDREVNNAPIPVLVEFWHESSEDCQTFAPTLEALALEYKGRLKVGKLHTGKGPKIADFYQIRSIPVTMLFVEGVEYARFSGVKTKDQLAAWVNSEVSRPRQAP